MQVRSVYADRSFGASTADTALARQQVKGAVIPRRDRPAPVERTRAWKRRYRFRNGSEGRISQLKRRGLFRARLRGLPGAQTWVGGVALAHNLQRMARRGASASGEPPAFDQSHSPAVEPISQAEDVPLAVDFRGGGPGVMVRR